MKQRLSLVDSLCWDLALAGVTMTSASCNKDRYQCTYICSPLLKQSVVIDVTEHRCAVSAIGELLDPCNCFIRGETTIVLEIESLIWCNIPIFDDK